jgi:hypothetical protein
MGRRIPMPMVGRVLKTDIWKENWIMETGKEKNLTDFLGVIRLS